MRLRFAIFLSAHGFGHATRMIALGHELSARGAIVHFRADVPAFLFAGLSLSAGDNLKRSISTLDVGYVQSRFNRIDPDTTWDRLRAFYSPAHVEAVLKEEARFLATYPYDAVLADMPPLAFALAERHGLPSFAVGNFDWATIYAGTPPSNPQPGDAHLLDQLRAWQRLAKVAFRLPMATGFGCFRQVVDTTLLVHEPGLVPLPEFMRGPIEAFTAKGPGERLAMVAIGGQPSEPLDITRLLVEGPQDITYVGPALNPAAVPEKLRHRVRTLKRELIYHEVLRRCDFVVGKLGYGTLSECAAYDKPFVATWRAGYPEDEAFLRLAPQHLRLLPVASAEYDAWAFGPKIEAFLASPAAPAPLPVGGAAFIADELVKLLG